MRILIVEDDRELADLVATGLRDERYAVDVARTRAAAVALLVANGYDVACVDLGLPDGDGLGLVAELSRPDAGLHRPERIIVTSARDSVADRVAGLDNGADDYLVKPFAFAELVARVRALARRDRQTTTTLVVGDLEIDLVGHRVTRDGRPIVLTAREFAVLRFLAHHPDRVVTVEEIIEHVWDANADPFSDSARVILGRLRRKLGTPPRIVTVIGAGYRLEAGA